MTHWLMKHWIWLALILITLLGAGFRLYRLDEKSLWSDEIATIATSMGNSVDPVAYNLRHVSFDPPQPVPAGAYLQKATQPHSNGNLTGNLTQVAEVLQANVHPPLFFWLMNRWIHTAGLQAGPLRVPAAVFGILCIPLMFWLALEFTALATHNNRQQSLFSGYGKYAFALQAAGFMAMSAYQIDHAQDARQYTLLLIFAMLAVGLTIRITRQHTRSIGLWLALTIVLLAGLYTQYFFLNMIMLVFGYLIWHGRHDRRFLAYGLGMTVLLALGFLPWWTVFKEQLGFLKFAGHYNAGLWKPLQLPEKLWRIACEFFMPESAIGKIIPLIVLLLAVGVSVAPGKKITIKKPCMSIALGLLLAWVAAIMGGQVVIDLLKHSHTATIRRYLLLASPACYLLMAYGLVCIGQRLQRPLGLWIAGGLSTLLCGAILADTTQYLQQDHASSDEFKQAAVWINHAAQPNDVVLVSKSGAMAVGMAYYLNPNILMRGIDVPEYRILRDGSPLMHELQRIAQAKPTRRIWLVFSHEAPSTRERLSAWLRAQGYRSTVSYKVPGVVTGLWEPEVRHIPN